MKDIFDKPIRLGCGMFGIALVIGAIAGYIARKHAVNAPPPATQPTTAPAPSAPATRAAASPPQLDGAYLRVVRSTYPQFPATQPFSIPLELSQAAHLVLHEPVYLSREGRGEMWITSPNAPPTDAVLKEAADPKKDVDVHVVREHVLFVHGILQANGGWTPILVCRTGDGGSETVSTANARQRLPDHRGRYYWEHAVSWNERLVVPTLLGVSIFRAGSKIDEDYHNLVKPEMDLSGRRAFAEPRAVLEQSGLLAWIPWEVNKRGGNGAARLVETAPDNSAAPARGKWTDLNPDNGWPEKILHLVPLLDGSVLMMSVDDRDAVHVQFNALDRATVKEEDVTKLVDQLSDADQKIRNAAYDELAQYGPGIWPILEKMLNDEGPEAQTRMRQLLKQKVTASLNGMVLLGNKSLKLVARLSDGGTVFFAEAGVEIPNPENPDAGPDYRVPAWISIRPGRPIELLPQTLTADLTAGQSELYVNGNDWIVTHDGRGPRRFVGNGFVNLLRKSEHRFSEFVGVDRRGRWIFQTPVASNRDATQPTADAPTTLIIDPTLPDPTPRLPVWQFRTAQTVGWTKEGWPVAKNASAFALHETDWQLLDEKEAVYSDANDASPLGEPPALQVAGSQPTTQPSEIATTQPATSPTTAPVEEKPIFTNRAGTRYFGGLTELRVRHKDGKDITWPLPPTANGIGPATLIQTADGRFYLFNQPGRVVRIKATPDGVEPFSVEKIFTHRIPTVDHPTRIWLDPAGRIVIAWDNQLAFLFPDGYIPQPIVEKMGPENQDADEQ